MKHAALIVNPKAGRGVYFRRRFDEVSAAFRCHGYEIQVEETTAEPNSASQLAREASHRFSLVIACGGDGTVHEVLQGLAESRAVLGVLPFGTANALARNLSLPTDPIKAIQKLLTFTPQAIPLGVAETSHGIRWFTVMAGAGPDGRLVHEMKRGAKARVGRGAYYAEAARLFLTRRFPIFNVEYRLVGSQEWRQRRAVAMMASRIPDLGGLFSGLTTACRLHHPHLLVQLLSSPAHLALPAWMAFGRTGLGSMNPWLTSFEVDELRCVPVSLNQETFAQVDGETVGPLPISLRVVPSALQLLMPEID